MSKQQVLTSYFYEQNYFVFISDLLTADDYFKVNAKRVKKLRSFTIDGYTISNSYYLYMFI